MCSYFLIAFWQKDTQNGYCGAQGVHHHAHRRHGDDRRAVPAVHATSHAGDPAADAGGAGASPPARRSRRRGPAAARRRRRQVGAAAAADLAARRHGRPDAGQRTHPRRHDGDRRRVPHRAHARPVHAGAGRAARGRRHRRRRRCSTPASAPCADATSSAPGLLHGQPDRLHVPRPRRRRVGRRHVPLHDARLLQGAALPRRRRDHRGARRRARHLQDGRPAARAARRVLDVHDRRRITGGPAARHRRLLQQGPHHLDEPGLGGRQRMAVGRRRRRRAAHRHLLVPARLPRLLRRAADAGHAPARAGACRRRSSCSPCSP